MTGDDLGICNRCLVVQDARVSIFASWSSGGLTDSDFPPNPTSPASLLTWVENMRYGNRATFTIDDYTGAFVAISTWHGDPVCAIHLYELVAAERHGRGT